MNFCKDTYYLYNGKINSVGLFGKQGLEAEDELDDGFVAHRGGDVSVGVIEIFFVVEPEVGKEVFGLDISEGHAGGDAVAGGVGNILLAEVVELGVGVVGESVKAAVDGEAVKHAPFHRKAL